MKGLSINLSGQDNSEIMINNLLTSFFSSIGLEKSRNRVSTSPASPKNEKDISIEDNVKAVYKDNIEKDIKSIENHFGPLTPGRVIDVPLHRLLEICPRTRRKSDAYKGLRSELKRRYEIDLEIISNTKHYENT